MNALVVDDSRATRAILKRILASLGLELAAEASNGVEALARLGEIAAPDLMLVDWNMPEMNGLELVQSVRADAAYAATRILMVTTESEAAQISTALAAGADEFLMKPFSADDLRAKLELLGWQG